MERVTHYRPRVGRETRLLVTTVVLAMVALWMLARLRFPSPPAEPRAVTQILNSLGAGADFDGLASQVARVRGLVGASLFPVELDAVTPGGASLSSAAMRLGGDVALVYIPEGRRLRASNGVALLSRDPASSLALVRLPLDPGNTSTPRIAPPPEAPQYVVATSMYPDGVALRPVFVAATARVEAPSWSGFAYAIPAETGLAPGTFLFTREGEFAGLTVVLGGAPAFVSADTVLDEANRLIAKPETRPVDFGVQVQGLSPTLASALRATSGVVVTWVDPQGPSRNVLVARDVIETVDGEPIPTIEHWRRLQSTLQIGSDVPMTVKRGGATLSVTVVPSTVAAADDEGVGSARRSLGASLREIAGQGSQVAIVESDSLAARAGLTVGDVLTEVGDTTSPTPSQIARSVASLHDGQTLLITIRRGDDHRLLVLEP